MCCAVLCLVTQSCPTLCEPIDCSPPDSSVHGDSSGKNTGVGCHALLQGIFSTQGSNPGLPHCRRILYHLTHQGSPRILQWVAIPSPGDLPYPGLKPGCPALQADSLPAESLQWRPTICIPMHCSLPGSSVHEILHARILEWVRHARLQGICPTQESSLHLLLLLH